ncbi:MAG TPA: hypothetical protein VK601_28035, partial [Kofleriaceae bacterium]|nr:hypothetical protein [Kofleriaceae bacterium]
MARIVITRRYHMLSAKRFASSSRMLAGIVRISLGVAMGLVPSCAVDDTGADPAMPDDTADAAPDDAGSTAVCTTGRLRCHAQIQTTGRGTERRITSHAVAPIGMGATDLQAAYGIDPSRLATAAVPTIA